jgi:hypothetical protein
MALAENEPSDSYLRYSIPAAASREFVAALFRRIGEECRKGEATRALVVTHGSVSSSRHDLCAAVVKLSEAGCPKGFKLACVAAVREVFEDFVAAEEVGQRLGIATRVFFDETNATRWLAW